MQRLGMQRRDQVVFQSRTLGYVSAVRGIRTSMHLSSSGAAMHISQPFHMSFLHSCTSFSLHYGSRVISYNSLWDPTAVPIAMTNVP